MNLRHHSIRFGRVLLVCVLVLVVAALVAVSLEPLLRLGMFLGLVAPHLPARGG